MDFPRNFASDLVLVLDFPKILASDLVLVLDFPENPGKSMVFNGSVHFFYIPGICENTRFQEIILRFWSKSFFIYVEKSVSYKEFRITTKHDLKNQEGRCLVALLPFPPVYDQVETTLADYLVKLL